MNADATPKRPVSTSNRLRVKCPGCGKRVALRKEGMIWHHNSGRPEYPGSRHNAHCRRSGTALTENEGTTNG